MKQLLFIILIFLFVSNAYAEWKIWGTDGDDIVYYINYDSIEIKDGYVFYWFLMNYLNPNKNAPKSTSMYLKADCNIFEVKPIKAVFFIDAMGKNKKNEFNYSLNEVWRSYAPNSNPRIILNSICKKANKYF